MLRVAVAQFETGKDTDRVLDEMLARIGEAAAGGARLVHFQECCNYPTSYDSREHAWNEAITVPGPMIDAISAKAKECGIFVGFNAAVRGAFPDATMVNHLIGDDGAYVGGNAKQVLMFIEHDAFRPATAAGEVFDTKIGRIGLLSCMDGLVPETSRNLACAGADIVLNSLCSNALDEAHLHIPARAAENGYFMISANRVGDMVKGKDLETLMQVTGMTREFVAGAGESQVVGPDGAVLVRASHDDAELVFADIDLDTLQREDRLSRRRPDCYGLIGESNESLATLIADRPDAGNVSVTTIVPASTDFAAALQETSSLIAQAPRGLCVLPELFAWQPAQLAGNPAIAAQIVAAVATLSNAAASAGTYVVAGIPASEGDTLTNRAMLIGPSGVIGEYRQIHSDPALGFDGLGDDLPVFDLPFGRVAMLLGEDLIFPEACRVLARKGADLIACPATWRAEWVYELMLPARAAESHVTIVGVGRADSPVSAHPTVATTPPVYRFPETKEVNNPDRHTAPSATGAFTVTIDLAPNRDKRLMAATDLILDTQPQLYGRLVAVTEKEAA